MITILSATFDPPILCFSSSFRHTPPVMMTHPTPSVPTSRLSPGFGGGGGEAGRSTRPPRLDARRNCASLRAPARVSPALKGCALPVKLPTQAGRSSPDRRQRCGPHRLAFRQRRAGPTPRAAGVRPTHGGAQTSRRAPSLACGPLRYGHESTHVQTQPSRRARQH
jgi:hypothetical protein